MIVCHGNPLFKYILLNLISVQLRIDVVVTGNAGLMLKKRFYSNNMTFLDKRNIQGGIKMNKKEKCTFFYPSCFKNPAKLIEIIILLAFIVAELVCRDS